MNKRWLYSVTLIVLLIALDGTLRTALAVSRSRQWLDMTLH